MWRYADSDPALRLTTETTAVRSSSKSAPPPVSIKTNSSITPLIEKPLVFQNLDLAYKGFFPELQARKLNHNYNKLRAHRHTLTIPGLPLIVTEATTKNEHRRALVKRALSLGIVKLKSS